MDKFVGAAVRDAVASELDGVRMTFERLAEHLCLDEVVSSRHAVRLQQFDELAQILSELANVLRYADNPNEVLASIRLDTLRTRLRVQIGSM